MEKIEYKEIQKFKQKWIWFLLIGMFGLFIWGAIHQLILGKPWGNNPAPDYILILFSIIPIGLILLFYYSKLETTITERGITYRFIPFLKKHVIDWNMVEYAEVRKYKPLREYGGWGIRFGIKGKAFNVSGNVGIELKLKNRKRTILFGTQNPEELKRVIEQLIEKRIIKAANKQIK